MRYVILLLLLLSTPVFAQTSENPFRSTEYPLPRFVSLASSEAYIRSGPGKKYPVQWVFKRSGLPVEIILEFEHWRKIRDVEGQEGWLHKSLLSGKRTALVKTDEDVPIYSKASSDSKMAAYLEPMVLVQVKECNGEWCYIDASGYKGWIQQQNLWGVYPKESFED